MVANEAGYTNGTGATLVVKNNAGEEFATYTLIIFGDVNGDGEVLALDATKITLASLGAEIAGGAVYEFAADINGDGEILAVDATKVTLASLGAPLTSNPYINN